MLDYSYSDEQKLLRENIRKWGKEHLPEEKIAEAYKNRGIDSAIAKSWVDEGLVSSVFLLSTAEPLAITSPWLLLSKSFATSVVTSLWLQTC